MFTVKVYRARPNGPVGSGLHSDRLSIYECRSIEVEDTGVVLRGACGTGEEMWIPRPNVEAPPSDDSDERVMRVIIENSSGKTTEVING